MNYDIEIWRTLRVEMLYIYRKRAHTWPEIHKISSTEIHFIDSNSAGITALLLRSL
jgi:hypothetical protein